MRLLVCGGAGFIGSNFIRHVLAAYPEYHVVNYDKLTYAGNLANLDDVARDPRYAFERGDIVDAERVGAVIRGHGITDVINFAAETHVDRSIHVGATEFVLTNTLGVQTLLDAVRANGLHRFLNVSTDEVHGSLALGEDRKFDENTPLNPSTPYAAAKAGGDLMCSAYYATYKVPVIVTRCSNNYGPYQFPEKLIPYFVLRLLKGEKVPVYGDGLNVRDWIHVEDHASALALLLHRGEPGGTYNIGVDNECSNIELTKRILALLGLGEERIEYVTDRPGHDRRYAVDASKVRALGWRPSFTRERFEEGLRATIDWYRQNPQWVERLWARQGEINAFHGSLERSAQEMPTAT